mmetsp:Transcript_81683/g.142061  ORF Transcript_81683/g.142061 Transcript_81683/m.142061 type:complete len:278 (-) Transcript_81683:84-917(-)
MAESTTGSTDQVWIGDLPAELTEELVKSVFSNYGEIAWLRAIAATVPGHKGQALVQFSSADDASWLFENLNGNIPEGLTEPIQVKFSVKKESSKGGKGGKGGKGEKDWGKSGWSQSNGSSDTGNSYGKAGGKTDAGKGSDKGSGPYSNGKSGKGGKDEVSKMKALIKGAVKGGYVPSGDRPEENCLYIQGLPGDCSDRDLYELFAPFGAIEVQGVKASQKGGQCSGIGFVDFSENAATMAAMQALNGLDNCEGGTLNVAQKKPPTKKGYGKGKGWRK